ncbi:MAG TPA: hypothetical protein VGL86_02060 [Polyangia bacterium]|jgi:hypothetical protein
MRALVVLALFGCGGSGLPSTQPSAQVTESIDPLDAFAPVTVHVPAGALNVSVWRNSETIVALQILMLDGGGVPIYDVELPAGAVMLEPAPLADDVNGIMVTKEDGPETRVRLIFEVQ